MFCWRRAMVGMNATWSGSGFEDLILGIGDWGLVLGGLVVVERLLPVTDWGFRAWGFPGLTVWLHCFSWVDGWIQ
jgi:hypothetical protein